MERDIETDVGERTKESQREMITGREGMNMNVYLQGTVVQYGWSTG